MLLTSILNSRLYHGTSRNRFESISEKGFLHGDPHYNNYLAPTGTYLIFGRPLVARRFARIVAEEDCSTPVVISLCLDSVTEDETIDLTTDEGMHLLYVGYTEIRRMSKRRKRSNKSRTPKTYNESLLAEQESVELWLDELFALEISTERNSINWDSPVLKYISQILGQRLIIAAIQEGTTFNKPYSGKQPKYNISSNYRGIRIRDHIELCVLDISLINETTIKERPESDDSHFFTDGFGLAILDTFNPDAE